MNRVDFGDQKETKVLILHGWTPTGHTSWIHVAEQLAQRGISSTLLDMPGFGQSPAPTEVWGAQDYAKYIVEWIKDNRESYQAIIGHSFGGGVASQIASLSPKHIDNIILVAPAIVRKPAKPSSSKLNHPFLKPLKAIYRLIVGSKDYNQSKGIMKDVMKRVIHEDLTHNLKSIEAKTTLIWGDKDTYTPYNDAKVVQKSIPDSTLITYDGINHGVHLHAADRLVGDIINTLH